MHWKKLNLDYFDEDTLQCELIRVHLEEINYRLAASCQRALLVSVDKYSQGIQIV